MNFSLLFVILSQQNDATIRLVLILYYHLLIPSSGIINNDIIIVLPLQPCKVRAFSIKDQSSTVAFEIKFEDSVITRDKLLDTMK